MSPDGRHAADPTPDEGLAEVAQDREHLLAAIRETEPAKPTGPWLVVRQYNQRADETVCAHRWEWLADLCAYRHTARHAHEIGAHFTVRRAEGDLRTRRNPRFFCATCCADEGEEHLDWCHREGAMGGAS